MSTEFSFTSLLQRRICGPEVSWRALFRIVMDRELGQGVCYHEHDEGTFFAGVKIFQNMGYVHGKGLGANKQGITEPVTAKVRPGRGAVGAYGAEQKGVKFGGESLLMFSTPF